SSRFVDVRTLVRRRIALSLHPMRPLLHRKPGLRLDGGAGDRAPCALSLSHRRGVRQTLPAPGRPPALLDREGERRLHFLGERLHRVSGAPRPVSDLSILAREPRKPRGLGRGGRGVPRSQPREALFGRGDRANLPKRRRDLPLLTEAMTSSGRPRENGMARVLRSRGRRTQDGSARALRLALALLPALVVSACSAGGEALPEDQRTFVERLLLAEEWAIAPRPTEVLDSAESLIELSKEAWNDSRAFVHHRVVLALARALEAQGAPARGGAARAESAAALARERIEDELVERLAGAEAPRYRAWVVQALGGSPDRKSTRLNS